MASRAKHPIGTKSSQNDADGHQLVLELNDHSQIIELSLENSVDPLLKPKPQFRTINDHRSGLLGSDPSSTQLATMDLRMRSVKNQIGQIPEIMEQPKILSKQTAGLQLGPQIGVPHPNPDTSHMTKFKELFEEDEEAELKLRKGSKYNLDDDFENDFAIHQSLSLSEVDDFDEDVPRDVDEDPFVGIESGSTSSKYLNLHAGNDTPESTLVDEMENLQKSKKQVMSEIISKNKFYKAGDVAAWGDQYLNSALFA